MLAINTGDLRNMGSIERQQLDALLYVFNTHLAKNEEKTRYYEGHIPLSRVNLGIALPKGLEKLEVGCAWGEKTVDVLASRSMFDGYVGEDGGDAELMSAIMDANNLKTQYMRACRDELKHGCAYATLSYDSKAGCRIRFHSSESAAALWDGAKGRISCGLAIADTRMDDTDYTWRPSQVNFYTDDSIWVLLRSGETWHAERRRQNLGVPWMVPMAYNATSFKPFGRSRLKAPIRHLIDGYVRTMANAAIALEFATSPQKYLLGVTDEQYDAIVGEKFRMYIGSLLTATVNTETGENPEFGQLAQGTLEPHISMLRMLATQFSAATGLTVMDTGVVNDANPTSSDAILAQSQTLVSMAEQLNAANGNALYTISQMAQAIAGKTKIESLPDEQKNIIAHFKNPSMPSVSVTADAAIKIASARQDFAGTDVFLEMIGFDQADIRRIRAQEQRARGRAILSNLEEE